MTRTHIAHTSEHTHTPHPDTHIDTHITVISHTSHIAHSCITHTDIPPT